MRTETRLAYWAALVAFALIDPAGAGSRVRGAGGLTIELSAAPNINGTVRAAVWKGEATFLKLKPYKEATATMVNGRATVVFADLEPGDFAVSAFFDKNNNAKLDTNFIGKPTEPIGFSNDAKGNRGSPKYKDALFEVGNDSRTISVQLE